jgi:hypothetical protein
VGSEWADRKKNIMKRGGELIEGHLPGVRTIGAEVEVPDMK